MAGNIAPFNIPDFAPADNTNPTEQEVDDWVGKLNIIVAGLDNIITFFNFTTPVIPLTPQVAAGANLPTRLAHVLWTRIFRTQVILFQGLVLAKAQAVVRRDRPSIKVQRPTFDGQPVNARGFLAGLATYRHL